MWDNRARDDDARGPPQRHRRAAGGAGRGAREADEEAARAARVEAELAVAKAKASDDQAVIAHQQLQIAKLTRQLYGQRSERTVRLLDQMELALEELESSATQDEAAPVVSASRTAAGARNFHHHPELGACAAGAPQCLPRRRQAGRRTLRGRRGGHRRLPASQNAPGRRDARHLSRAPPRAAHPRLAAPRRAGPDPCLAQAGPRAPARADGALSRDPPTRTYPTQCSRLDIRVAVPTLRHRISIWENS